MTSPIPLDRADFFELQALVAKAEYAALVAAHAKAAAQAKLVALSAVHDFDATKPYRLEETAHALVCVEDR
jgi:hypothetical protein